MDLTRDEKVTGIDGKQYPAKKKTTTSTTTKTTHVVESTEEPQDTNEDTKTPYVLRDEGEFTNDGREEAGPEPEVVKDKLGNQKQGSLVIGVTVLLKNNDPFSEDLPVD